MIRRSSPPYHYGGTAFGTSPMPPRTPTPRTLMRGGKSGISPLAKAMWESKNAPTLQFRAPKHGQSATSPEQEAGYPFCAQSVGTCARRAIESEEESESECNLPISLGRAPPSFSLGTASETLLLIVLFFCLFREGNDRLLCLSILFLIVCVWLPITPFILSHIN